jgi:hypothetical protein
MNLPGREASRVGGICAVCKDLQRSTMARRAPAASAQSDSHFGRHSGAPRSGEPGIHKHRAAQNKLCLCSWTPGSLASLSRRFASAFFNRENGGRRPPTPRSDGCANAANQSAGFHMTSGLRRRPCGAPRNDGLSPQPRNQQRSASVYNGPACPPCHELSRARRAPRFHGVLFRLVVRLLPACFRFAHRPAVLHCIHVIRADFHQ